jgi:hypothetical protein
MTCVALKVRASVKYNINGMLSQVGNKGPGRVLRWREQLRASEEKVGKCATLPTLHLTP